MSAIRSKMYIGLQVRYTLYSSDYNAIEFCRRSFEKYFNIKFNENPFSGSRVVPCGPLGGRTDRYDEVKFALRNFANGPKMPKIS